GIELEDARRVDGRHHAAEERCLQFLQILINLPAKKNLAEILVNCAVVVDDQNAYRLGQAHGMSRSGAARRTITAASGRNLAMEAHAGFKRRPWAGGVII